LRNTPVQQVSYEISASSGKVDKNICVVQDAPSNQCSGNRDIVLVTVIVRHLALTRDCVMEMREDGPLAQQVISSLPLAM
jgi:hypothetical protein